jgi:hypothetical protein
MKKVAVQVAFSLLALRSLSSAAIPVPVAPTPAPGAQCRAICNDTSSPSPPAQDTSFAARYPELCTGLLNPFYELDVADEQSGVDYEGLPDDHPYKKSSWGVWEWRMNNYWAHYGCDGRHSGCNAYGYFYSWGWCRGTNKYTAISDTCSATSNSGNLEGDMAGGNAFWMKSTTATDNPSALGYLNRGSCEYFTAKNDRLSGDGESSGLDRDLLVMWADGADSPSVHEACLGRRTTEDAAKAWEWSLWQQKNPLVASHPTYRCVLNVGANQCVGNTCPTGFLPARIPNHYHQAQDGKDCGYWPGIGPCTRFVQSCSGVPTPAPTSPSDTCTTVNDEFCPCRTHATGSIANNAMVSFATFAITIPNRDSEDQGWVQENQPTMGPAKSEWEHSAWNKEHTADKQKRKDYQGWAYNLMGALSPPALAAASSYGPDMGLAAERKVCIVGPGYWTRHDDAISLGGQAGTNQHDLIYDFVNS